MKNTFLLFVFTLVFLSAGATLNAQGDDDAKDFSELTLSKSFTGESVATTKKFSVSANYILLRLELKGSVRSGLIAVTLLKPDGNKFKTIEIDPTSDVKFEQTLDLKKNPTDWVGDWQVKIQTDKAEGYYKLFIYTR